MNNYRSGFVTLLGRPNVGKSTLINKLIGEKITITSPIAQTTRNKLKGILTTKNGQIIFVDTPGVSTKIICPFFVVSIPFNLFLVVCAMGEVIVIFSPINLFIKVDLPTFGLPSKVTKPDL